MTIEQLRTVHGATPFKPFTLHLADGRRVTVPHRDFLSHSPSGRTVIVHHNDDTFSILDLLLVTEVEVHNGSSKAVIGGEVADFGRQQEAHLRSNENCQKPPSPRRRSSL